MTDQLGAWEAACTAVRSSILAGERPTFTARAVADDGFWYIEIDGVPSRGDAPGAYTQARSRAEIEVMARDVTALTLVVPPDSFDLLIETKGDGPA